MCNIPDYQNASNAKYIPRKSNKNLIHPDIPFLGLLFSVILTFERKFGTKRGVLSITPQKHLSFRASERNLISLKLKISPLGRNDKTV